MFVFFGLLFSSLKGIHNTCAIQTQVNKQASVARILFAEFFGIFPTSINKILLHAQISEYNKKLSTTPNTYDISQDTRNTTPTAPQLHTLQNKKLQQNISNRANLNKSWISTKSTYPHHSTATKCRRNI